MKTVQFFSTLIALYLTLGASFLAPAHGASVRLRPDAVLELFTSQGCSSCPPADALLSQYDDGENVVALAYHVDYWDYIGWQDTFGAPENSDLQRAYAQAQGKSRIYTPQILVNGVEDVVGSRNADIVAAVAAGALVLPIDMFMADGMISVEIAGQGELSEAVVWVVTFRSDVDVEITRGENKDRMISYSQVVTDRRVLGMWEPTSGLHIKLPVADLLGVENDGAAILVQEEHNGLPGAILGAASFTR